jgi:GYF domain 2
MSQRIFYEIDGHVHGPITLTQLQLMAASGMLMPHHRVKREGSEQWFVAQTVQGLFAEPAPQPAPVVGLLPAPVGSVLPAAPADEEIPFGGFGATESEEAPGLNPAFDFFSDESEPSPSKRAKSPKQPRQSGKQAKQAAAAARTREPQPFELIDSDAPGTIADSNIQPIGNPMGKEPAAPADLPLAEAIDEVPSASRTEPKSPPSKSAESKFEARQSGKTDIISAPAVTVAAEVTGRAVDFLPDDSLHLLDGKTSFRLHRSWLHAVSKFADGSTRSIYLRLQQIDAGILDQRPTTSRGKSAPSSLLAFVAGDTRIGLVFHDSDKLYRTFLERTLLLCNAVNSQRPAGKA